MAVPRSDQQLVALWQPAVEPEAAGDLQGAKRLAVDAAVVQWIRSALTFFKIIIEKCIII